MIRICPPADFSLGVVLLAPMAQWLVLVHRVREVVIGAGTPGVAHPLDVPRRAHGPLVILGGRELRELLARNLLAEVARAHWPPGDGPVLVLPEQDLVELAADPRALFLSRAPPSSAGAGVS